MSSLATAVWVSASDSITLPQPVRRRAIARGAFRSRTPVGVGDPLIAQIDSFFGALHRATDTLADGLDGADRVKGHGERLKADHEARKPVTRAPLTLAGSAPNYRVEEVTDAESGEVSYDVVSADGSERVECKTRASAEKTCRALEASA